MYASEVGGRRLNFTVSGMLWKRSLVMRDEETGSLWSHQLGRAMRGELEGAELEMLPSTMTDWASWKRRHPETAVIDLRRTAADFTRKLQQEAGRYVLGLEGRHTNRAYPYDTARKMGVINDTLDGQPLLVTYDPAGASANAFVRELPGREGEPVQFAPQGTDSMRDSLTGSRWDRQSGRAIDGEKKGAALKRLPGVPSFARAWNDFHPGSSTYGE